MRPLALPIQGACTWAGASLTSRDSPLHPPARDLALESGGSGRGQKESSCGFLKAVLILCPRDQACRTRPGSATCEHIPNQTGSVCSPASGWGRACPGPGAWTGEGELGRGAAQGQGVAFLPPETLLQVPAGLGAPPLLPTCLGNQMGSCSNCCPGGMGHRGRGSAPIRGLLGPACLPPRG